MSPGFKFTEEELTPDWEIDFMGPLKRAAGAPRELQTSTELECNHEFVDVGFQFSKFVCSKCNLERK